MTNQSFEHRTLWVQAGEIRLEGDLAVPQETIKGRAVFCHPYPPMGGDMDNNVVLSAQKALAQTSFACLRFNFRGVGLSQGAFDNGRAEVQDVQAALNQVRELDLPGDKNIVLGGYSFGAIMAAKVAATTEDLAGVILIAPPIKMFNTDSLAEIKAPLLAFAGYDDDFSDMEKVRELVKNQANATTRSFPDVDHFWFGYEQIVEREIAAFISDIMA